MSPSCIIMRRRPCMSAHRTSLRCTFSAAPLTPAKSRTSAGSTPWTSRSAAAREPCCAAAAAHEKTLRDRPVEAHVVSYGDNSIQYVLRFWARTEDYWACYNDVLDGLQETFSSAGITMSYPHINVHMES